MRAIRILFAIFSFSIFSHDLQLRSSDLFRFSAADLGGLDDHRDCGRIVLDGLVAHFLGLLPHGLASAFAALHGRGGVLAGAASAPSVATEAIAAIAPLRAFRLLIFFLLSSACAVLQSPRQVSQTNLRGVLDEQNVNSRLHKVNTYLKSSFRQPSFPTPPKY